MFFDEITLSKKSWHYQLQKATFRSSTPDFQSFCPYFWITIFCLIISPLTLLFYMFIMWPLDIFDKLVSWPALNEYIDKLDDSYLVDLLGYEYEYNWEKGKFNLPKSRSMSEYYERENYAINQILLRHGISRYTTDGN